MTGGYTSGLQTSQLASSYRRHKNMWKRKTKEDYKKVKEKIFLDFSKSDLITSFSIAVFATLSVFYYLQTISYVIFSFVLFFFLSCIGVLLYDDPTFIMKIIFSGSSAPEFSSDICNACYSIVLRSNNKICECGGEYEPLDNWKWIEDKIEETEQTN